MNIFLYSGLALYTVNYIIGWLLHLGIISMTKRTHQIFYASIIVNLLLILFFIPMFSKGFFICSASLAMMIILPFGKKGGVYHITVATLGFVSYTVFFLVNIKILNLNFFIN